MQELGNLNGRKIFYTGQATELAPTGENNFMLLVLADTYKTKVHETVLEKALEKTPLFIYCCCVNFPDMEDAVVDLLCEKFGDVDDESEEENEMPLTFGENDLVSSLDFCINHAFHEVYKIEEVIVLDLRVQPEGDEIKNMLETTKS